MFGTRMKPGSLSTESVVIPTPYDREDDAGRNSWLRACFKIGRGPAARDFGRGQGGEFRASAQRAVRSEPTPATGKRPAARRVFGQKAVWLSLLLGHRPVAGMQGARAEAPRRASPSGLFPENRPPANFKTGSESVD